MMMANVYHNWKEPYIYTKHYKTSFLCLTKVSFSDTIFYIIN